MAEKKETPKKSPETKAAPGTPAQEKKTRKKIVPLGFKFGLGLGGLLFVIMVLVMLIVINSVRREIVAQVMARGELQAKGIANNCIEFMSQVEFDMNRMKELLEIHVFVQDAVKKMEPGMLGVGEGVMHEVGQVFSTISAPIVAAVWGQRKFEADVLYASVVYKNGMIISHSEPSRNRTFYNAVEQGLEDNTGADPLIQTRTYKQGVKVYDLDYPMMYFDKKVGDVHLGISSETIDIAVRQTGVSIALIALTLGGIGIIVTFIVANVMVQPIGLLQRGVNAIAEGNLDQKISAVSNDELGQLTDAFNDMASSLRDKEKMRSAFTKYVSSDVVDQAMAGDSVKLGGERREITVFFSDIRDFTPISESLSPEALVKMLNEYFNEMVQIITNHGGTLDKFMGDAIMAIYNAPNPQPDHALRAVLASLEMRKKSAEITAAWKKKGRKHILEMGMGINTGDVVVGNIGSDERLEYTAIGDTVNTCSRIEGVTRVYNVKTMIGEQTFKVVKDKVVCREVDFVRVKGKEKPARIYELVGDMSTDQAKLGIIEAFQRGLALYRRQEFDAAASEFRTVLKVDPTDGPAQVFIERCRQLKETPPGSKWDGVFSMTTKK